jgi:hypothetical protein
MSDSSMLGLGISIENVHYKEEKQNVQNSKDRGEKDADDQHFHCAAPRFGHTYILIMSSSGS